MLQFTTSQDCYCLLVHCCVLSCILFVQVRQHISTNILQTSLFFLWKRCLNRRWVFVRRLNSGALAARRAAKWSPILIEERKGNPWVDFLMVIMASGIACGRERTTATGTVSRNMAAILQKVGWEPCTSLILDIHAMIKTRYPLTSITWPYRGLKFIAHQGHIFFWSWPLTNCWFSFGPRVGSCQANFVKSGNGCLDGSQAALTCKPVILFVIIAAAVIVLGLGGIRDLKIEVWRSYHKWQAAVSSFTSAVCPYLGIKIRGLNSRLPWFVCFHSFVHFCFSWEIVFKIRFLWKRIW